MSLFILSDYYLTFNTKRGHKKCPLFKNNQFMIIGYRLLTTMSQGNRFLKFVRGMRKEVG